MKGVTKANLIRTKYGTIKVIIEVKEGKYSNRLIRKLRLVGIFIEKVK